MDPVDYDDTSEEEESDDEESSSSSSTHSYDDDIDNSTVKDTTTDSLNLAASLQQILQSHQQQIDAQQQNDDKSTDKHTKSKQNDSSSILSPTTHNKQSQKREKEDENTAFFILRSNNEENVRTSMEKCVWATQPQNEPILNDAFEKSDKVILFFSVCRSMHFQGVCQMTSQIGHHKSRSLWESDTHRRSHSHSHSRHRSGGHNKWGGTFTVRWLKIFDLPFDQTNHILNPWNGGRPVKFSRDGQALPVHVGESLLHLFEIGVNEYGQGSAILRKPIRIDDNRQIAVQKVFVNGQFVAATDTQTAAKLIEANDKNAELNRLVSTLQKESDSNPNGVVLDKVTVDAVTKLLSANMNETNGEKLDYANGKMHRHRSKESKRYKSSKRDRSRSRHRRKRRYHERERRDRDRDRERHRYYHKRRRYDEDDYGQQRRGSTRRRHRDKYDRNERRRDDRRHVRDDDNVKSDQEKVINSLWTQIQMQQAIMSQSGLLANNSSLQYPSNRGGVY